MNPNKVFSIDISIIIVNYNTAYFTKRCIESILRQTHKAYEIIVIDNASPNQDAEILRQFDNQVRLILNEKNLGFGVANNRAAELARGEYLFLLNPDTELIAEDSLSHILKFMREYSQYGLVGTRILKMDGEGETKPEKNYLGEKEAGYPYRNLPGKIAWVLGASMIIPQKVYQQVHGFDPDYFLYGEDTDLCLRIRKAGYEIGYLPSVAIRHVGGASEKKTDYYQLTLKKRKALYCFYKKHYTDQAYRRLVKKDDRVARIRLFFHGLLKVFHLSHSEKRYQHYLAIREFIHHLRIRDNPQKRENS